MSSLSCLWMLHIFYKDVKQNWLPLAVLPMGAALWRVLDLIWGFLLIITRETQSSLNIQVTAKENLTGSEERAVEHLQSHLSAPSAPFSAQSCIEWTQIPTLIQCLGAQQCTDTTSTKVTVILGHVQLGRQPCCGSFSSAKRDHRETQRYLQARTGTGTCTASPRHCVYTWQKDYVNIWKGNGLQLSLCLTLWLSTMC